MNLLEELKADHRAFIDMIDHIGQLADRLDRPIYADELVIPAAREALGILGSLIVRMRYHESKEEHILFEAIRRWMPGAEPVVAQMEREHEPIARLLADTHGRLPILARRSAHRLAAALRHLVETLRNHILREESELYRLAETGIPPVELEGLEQKAEAEEFPEFIDTGGGD